MKNLILLGLLFCYGVANGQETTDLAKESQNPVSNLISVPVKSSFTGGYAPDGRSSYVLLVQPVVPFRISQDWNLVVRPIFPIVTLPFPVGDRTTGTGDIVVQAYFTPARTKKIIWAVGPVLALPSASSSILGSGKWALGPSVVLLAMPGRWVYGGLINNVWSVAGDSQRGSVKEAIFNPFVNYNLKKGWSVFVQSDVSANWNGGSGQVWTVPVGGGFSRIFVVDHQPLSASISAYGMAVHPGVGPTWRVSWAISFLFPKKTAKS